MEQVQNKKLLKQEAVVVDLDYVLDYFARGFRSQKKKAEVIKIESFVDISKRKVVFCLHLKLDGKNPHTNSEAGSSQDKEKDQERRVSEEGVKEEGPA